MKRWCRGFVCVLLMAGPALARAESATLQVVSSGRPVSIALRVGHKRLRCTTPCRLELPVGRYHARVDGLDRTVNVSQGGSRYSVRPTRRGRQVVGLSLAVLGSIGLGAPTCWRCDIDGKTRLISALVGLGLLGLSLPVITSSSARLSPGRRPPDPAPPGPGHGLHLELQAGAVALLGPGLDESSRWRAGLGASYYPTDWLAVGPRWRIGSAVAPEKGHQLLATVHAHVRLPLVYLVLGAGAGYGFAPIADGERQVTDHGLLLETELGLRLALSRWVGLSAALIYQLRSSSAVGRAAWSHGPLLDLSTAVSF